MNEIVTKCPAKINLNLRILDKREDGYHNIQTDYQLIDIYDHLKFKSNMFPLICNFLKLSFLEVV